MRFWVIKAGATVRTYDPEALEESMKVLPDMVPCQDAYQTAEGADAIVGCPHYKTAGFERTHACDLKVLVWRNGVAEPGVVADVDPVSQPMG